MEGIQNERLAKKVAILQGFSENYILLRTEGLMSKQTVEVV
jgi:hypothetical protein